jgi:hypothetical protein
MRGSIDQISYQVGETGDQIALIEQAMDIHF